MDQNLKREIIVENYQNPVNKDKEIRKEHIKVNSNNVSCIDDINLLVVFDKDKIEDISFNGEACAISTSSTSIMIKNLLGKEIDEVNEFVQNFENMINEKTYDEKILKDAIVYDEIYKQKSRKTCALLPYEGIKKAIKEYKK